MNNLNSQQNFVKKWCIIYAIKSLLNSIYKKYNFNINPIIYSLNFNVLIILTIKLLHLIIVTINLSFYISHIFEIFNILTYILKKFI